MKSLGKRLLIVTILATAVAIGSDLWQAATPSVNPPPTAGGWQLSHPAVCGTPLKAETRLWLGTSAARRVCRAEYAGPSAMRLNLFEMPAGWPRCARAFDAFQKWLPSGPGKVGFFKGCYFGVVDSPRADRVALERFTLAIENALPGDGEGHVFRIY